MHVLLHRQLAKLGLSEDAPPDAAQWRAFVSRIGRTYQEGAQDRYTLERSLMTSSGEMQALYDDLARSEANFKLVVEGMPDAVFVHEDGVLRYANTAMAEVLGFETPGELLGTAGVELFVHPDDRAEVLEFAGRRRAGESLPVLQVRWVRRDGTTIHIEATSTRISYDGRAAIAVVARDITESLRTQEARERVERSLRLSEERYRVLFEGSPASIMLFDPGTFDILAVNEAALRLYGYDRDDFLRMKLTDLKTHEDEDLRRSMAEARSGPDKTWRGTKKHRKKDGTLIDVDIVSHPVVVEGRRAVLALATDVTERTRLEEQLRQAQKMEAVGRLAGGIAHDFNNILAVIVADADFLGSELGEDHPLTSDVRDIEAAAQRGAALTKQMLTFSRKLPSQPRVLSLNERITDLGKMLARTIGEDVRVKTVLHPRLGSIEADPGQVDQVLLNLVLNARDAMPRGGDLTLQTANAELSATEASGLGMAPGRCVRLLVTDTGVGMDAPTRARMFEPFFTTKEVGKGTGLGLATVFGIVKRAGGGLSVESEPGRGTTFRVLCPRVEADASRLTDRPSSVGLRGTETILVVEDEEPVRRVVRRLLASRGYEVLEANSATEALDLLDRPGRTPHLVLTDLVMPDMDGRALAAEVRIRRPGIRVLFMSGYTDHPALKGAALDPTDQLVYKPFTAQQMLTAVRAALATEAGVRAMVW